MGRGSSDDGHEAYERADGEGAGGRDARGGAALGRGGATAGVGRATDVRGGALRHGRAPLFDGRRRRGRVADRERLDLELLRLGVDVRRVVDVRHEDGVPLPQGDIQQVRVNALVAVVVILHRDDGGHGGQQRDVGVVNPDGKRRECALTLGARPHDVVRLLEEPPQTVPARREDLEPAGRRRRRGNRRECERREGEEAEHCRN
ncbi:hypothetical protein DFH09DRAFT_1185230, partial [Mycena vulgaris]